MRSLKPLRLLSWTVALLLSFTTPALADLLALLNYESKPNQPVRREGIAIMEIDPDVVPWYDDLVTHTPEIKDGHLLLPTRPGWGTEVNEAAVRAHPPRRR